MSIEGIKRVIQKKKEREWKIKGISDNRRGGIIRAKNSDKGKG
jgi:hypothetical protein